MFNCESWSLLVMCTLHTVYYRIRIQLEKKKKEKEEKHALFQMCVICHRKRMATGLNIVILYSSTELFRGPLFRMIHHFLKQAIAFRRFYPVGCDILFLLFFFYFFFFSNYTSILMRKVNYQLKYWLVCVIVDYSWMLFGFLYLFKNSAKS